MPVITDHNANLNRQAAALNRRNAKLAQDKRLEGQLRKISKSKRKRLRKKLQDVRDDYTLSSKAKRKKKDALKKLIRKATRKIDEHDANIENLENKMKGITSKLSEVNGERSAATYMAAFSANPPSMAPADTYAMVKGFTAPGPGIDQIWVRPADWDGTAQPTEIVIVEAKGGRAVLSTAQVYQGEEGIGGVALANGCQEMDNNWIYVNAGGLQSVAETTPLLAEVGRLIRAKLDNPAGPAPPLRKVVIQERNYNLYGQPVSNQVYPPLGVLAPVAQVNPAIAWINNSATKANLDTVSGMTDIVTRCTDIKADFVNLVTTPPAAHADPVFLKHLANLKARRKALRRLARIRAERAQALGGAASVAKKEKLKGSLGEIRGELLAAENMARRVQTGTANPAYKMVKGFSGPDKGIDQIWVSVGWDPNAIPAVPPAEIFVVEAKGYTATVGTTGAYEGALGYDGSTLTNGAPQMTKHWVYVNAATTATQADDSSDLKKVAEHMRVALSTGASPPAVRGVVISNGVVNNPWHLNQNADGTIHYN